MTISCDILATKFKHWSNRRRRDVETQRDVGISCRRASSSWVRWKRLDWWMDMHFKGKAEQQWESAWEGVPYKAQTEGGGGVLKGWCCFQEEAGCWVRLLEDPSSAPPSLFRKPQFPPKKEASSPPPAPHVADGSSESSSSAADER